MQMATPFDAQKSLEELDVLFDLGKINEPTYQCIADLIQNCDPDEQGEDFSEEISEWKKLEKNVLAEQFKKWRLEDLEEWKEDLTDEEFNKRFCCEGEYSSAAEVFDATMFSVVAVFVKEFF